jgi:hypothetical protein
MPGVGAETRTRCGRIDGTFPAKYGADNATNAPEEILVQLSHQVHD